MKNESFVKFVKRTENILTTTISRKAKVSHKSFATNNNLKERLKVSKETMSIKNKSTYCLSAF